MKLLSIQKNHSFYKRVILANASLQTQEVSMTILGIFSHDWSIRQCFSLEKSVNSELLASFLSLLLTGNYTKINAIIKERHFSSCLMVASFSVIAHWESTVIKLIESNLFWHHDSMWLKERAQVSPTLYALLYSWIVKTGKVATFTLCVFKTCIMLYGHLPLNQWWCYTAIVQAIRRCKQAHLIYFQVQRSIRHNCNSVPSRVCQFFGKGHCY